jgi:hypothetical protein
MSALKPANRLGVTPVPKRVKGQSGAVEKPTCPSFRQDRPRETKAALFQPDFRVG